MEVNDTAEKTIAEFFRLLSSDTVPVCDGVEEALSMCKDKNDQCDGVSVVRVKTRRKISEWKPFSDTESVLLTNFDRPIEAALWHGPAEGRDVIVCSSDLYHDDKIGDVLCDGVVLSSEWRKWFDKKTCRGRATLSAEKQCSIAEYTVIVK